VTPGPSAGGKITIQAHRTISDRADLSVYVSSLLRDRRRIIERYIDYFGDVSGVAHGTEASRTEGAGCLS